MDEQTLFGEYDDNGNLVKNVDTCILSGVAIEPGDATFQVGCYFYRVSSQALSQHTAEARAELEKLISQINKPAKAKKE